MYPTNVFRPVSTLTANAACSTLDLTRICVPSGDQATVSIQTSARSLTLVGAPAKGAGSGHTSMPVTRRDSVPSIPMTYSPTPSTSACAIASRWPSGDHDGPPTTLTATRRGSTLPAVTYSSRPTSVIVEDLPHPFFETEHHGRMPVTGRPRRSPNFIIRTSKPRHTVRLIPNVSDERLPLGLDVDSKHRLLNVGPDKNLRTVRRPGHGVNPGFRRIGRTIRRPPSGSFPSLDVRPPAATPCRRSQ